ncbi:MAG TPA: universal stress protein [Ilumatobacter sp.]|nr:universal stress protein [Ilumatobacter sp.]
MTTVLIALDQSDASHAAALAAAELFGPDASYLAINVADAPFDESAFVYGYAFPAVMPAMDDRPMSERVYETVTRARLEAARMSEEAGVSATALGDMGDPVTAILAAADEYGVDVIVTGWHDRNWFRGLFDKPVGETLVHKTNIPVLIVPTHDHDTH